MLEVKRGGTRPHSVENSLWKRLWTCHKTIYLMVLMMMVMMMMMMMTMMTTTTVVVMVPYNIWGLVQHAKNCASVNPMSEVRAAIMFVLLVVVS